MKNKKITPSEKRELQDGISLAITTFLALWCGFAIGRIILFFII